MNVVLLCNSMHGTHFWHAIRIPSDRVQRESAFLPRAQHGGRSRTYPRIRSANTSGKESMCKGMNIGHAQIGGITTHLIVITYHLCECLNAKRSTTLSQPVQELESLQGYRNIWGFRSLGKISTTHVVERGRDTVRVARNLECSLE